MFCLEKCVFLKLIIIVLYFFCPQRYLHSLEEAFEAHKYNAGCDRDVLVFSPQLKGSLVKKASFEKEWDKIKHKVDKTPTKYKKRSGVVEFIFMGALLSAMFWTIVVIAWNSLERHQMEYFMLITSFLKNIFSP
eukprot:m.130142 g.130142  ORF g.130142 m.130142 type:complete len:134 (+) comp9467_c0_seq10:2775-3176(+)